MEHYEQVTSAEPEVQEQEAAGGLVEEFQHPDHHSSPLHASSTTLPRRRRYHQRTGSRGSYVSILSDSEILLGDDENSAAGTTAEVTNAHYMDVAEGEKSPLHLSFDDDERSPVQSDPTSEMARGATTTILFGFDDSDDDDDYEEHLKRYNLGFRSESSAAPNNNHHGIFSIWAKIQQARQKARQRRAQYLLQQSEGQSWGQSTYFWLVATFCDATDGGIALVAIGLVAWLMLVWKVPENRKLYFLVGLIFWSIRFGARPARDYWIQRRLRLHREHQSEQQRQSRNAIAPTTRYEDSHDVPSFGMPTFSQQHPSMELSAVSDGMEEGSSPRLSMSSEAAQEEETPSFPRFLD